MEINSSLPGVSDIVKKFRYVFEPGLLKELEEKGKRLSVKEGEVLLDIGETIRAIPILLSGSFKVSRLDNEGRELLLYHINPTESCVMTFSCCMELHASEIRVVAEQDSEFLAVPVTALDTWMMKYPSWKTYVMKTIRIRFNELLKAIDQIAFQKLDERLIMFLKDRSKATGSSLINMSHGQIAVELASSRVVISRLLKKLENDKKVLLYRNQIKLLKAL